VEAGGETESKQGIRMSLKKVWSGGKKRKGEEEGEGGGGLSSGIGKQKGVQDITNK